MKSPWRRTTRVTTVKHPIDVRKVFAQSEFGTGIVSEISWKGDIKSWRSRGLGRVGNAAPEPTRFGNIS